MAEPQPNRPTPEQSRAGFEVDWTSPCSKGVVEITLTVDGAEVVKKPCEVLASDARDQFAIDAANAHPAFRLTHAKLQLEAELERVCSVVRAELAAREAERTEGGRGLADGGFEPFPLHTLPEPLRSFVEETATSIGCDPSMVAAPSLAACGAAIGNTRRVLLKGDWPEPPVIWISVVAESGTAKSPAIRAALQPLFAEQARKLKEHQDAEKDYKRKRREFEADLTLWKRERSEGKPVGPPPDEPDAPVARRVVCDDTTVEGLITLLADTGRGLLCGRDELSGWFKGRNEYKGGKGSDTSHWLSMFGATDVVVDRKGRGGTPLHARRAAVCLTGGIQPQVLRSCMSNEDLANGLFARFLYVMPPRQRRRWTEESVSQEIQEGYLGLLRGLWALEFKPTPDDPSCPIHVALTPEAKRVWVDCFNEIQDIQALRDGHEASTWSKLECYVPRLALVFHTIRRVDGGAAADDDAPVEAESIRDAWELVQWFGREAERVLGTLQQNQRKYELQRLMDYIRSRGGSISRRELTQGPARYRNNAPRAQTDLEELETVGVAWSRYERPAKTGPHVKRYYLHGPREEEGCYELGPEGVENGTRTRSRGEDAQGEARAEQREDVDANSEDNQGLQDLVWVTGDMSRPPRWK